MAKRRRKKKCRTICFSRKRNGEFGKGKCAPKRRRRKKSAHRSSGRRRSAAYSPRKHPRKANGQFKHKTGKSRKRKKSSHRAKRSRHYREGTYYDLSSRRVRKRSSGPYTPPSHQLSA